MNNGMITSGNWENFLTLRDEQLLLVKRSHPFVFILPIVTISSLTLFFISSAFVLFEQFISSRSLFLITTLLLVSIGISLIAKIIIDWYFHLYVFTTRKILELRYTPLAAYVANDIMLDRVNCTEIDLQTKGIVHELLDMGDILITFDRPTHQEEFVLKDIQGCHKLVTFLTQQLMDGTGSNEPIHFPIWFKSRALAK